MKCYNLYYKNVRLNKQPLSIDEYQKLKNAKTISKINYEKKTVDKVPFSSVRVVECIVI